MIKTEKDGSIRFTEPTPSYMLMGGIGGALAAFPTPEALRAEGHEDGVSTARVLKCVVCGTMDCGLPECADELRARHIDAVPFVDALARAYIWLKEARVSEEGRLEHAAVLARIRREVTKRTKKRTLDGKRGTKGAE